MVANPPQMLLLLGRVSGLTFLFPTDPRSAEDCSGSDSCCLGAPLGPPGEWQLLLMLLLSLSPPFSSPLTLPLLLSVEPPSCCSCCCCCLCSTSCFSWLSSRWRIRSRREAISILKMNKIYFDEIFNLCEISFAPFRLAVFHGYLSPLANANKGLKVAESPLRNRRE